MFAVFDFVQRRLCDVNMAALHQLRHLAIEEGQQQGANMGAIDIGIGHDDDAVVAQFVGVEIVFADIGAQGRDQEQDFIAGEQFFVTRFFHIQNFAAQGQNGLKFAIAPLFGRAPRRVTLDDVDFAQGWVFFLTISQLRRKS